MKKLSLLSSALFCVALASSTSAFAGTIFNFSFDSPSGTANQFAGSGQFTATEQGTSGIFTITGVSGTIVEGSNVGAGSTESITSLILAGGFKNNDNLLYFPISSNSNKAFDSFGVSFLLADGSSVHLYNGNNENLIEGTSMGGSSFSEGATINVSAATTSPVPEPGSLALLGTGILGLAGAIRRKLSV